LNGTYNPWLVLLSVIVAINASFVALDVASRIVASKGRGAEWYWLAGGAVSMGAGIWSMHFIGMLAFRLPIALSYDVALTLLSLLAAVLASGVALFIASRLTLKRSVLLVTGLLMSTGIVSMHYIGMAAMRMEPPIRYSPLLVAASVLVATVASIAAVWSAFTLRLQTIVTAFWKKAGSALVMGGGICGMHYIGMASASFAPNSVCTVVPQQINQAWLGGALGALTLLFLVSTLCVAAFDAYLSAVLDAKVATRTAAVDRMSAELRRLSHRLADIQDEERRLLASELHDIVGQNLSALSAEIALIRDRLPLAAREQLADRLARASTLAKRSVEAIRSVMAELRPPGLDELGLPVALRWHADTFQSRTGIGVTLSVDGSLPRPSLRVEDALLRITMEALNNVAKHSKARSVRLTLEARGDDIVLEIADDGRGFDPETVAPRTEGSGWGLMMMKERALSVGAELRVVSAPGKGTRVRIAISKPKWQ
jgi:NO-binding membrane sensor protein with MHYT domain/two-component sensor histidine kinase